MAMSSLTYIPVSYGILNPMVYPWYIVYWTPLLKNDPACMVNWTPMVFWLPYPWYIDPLPMIFWPTCLWYIKPSYGIVNSSLLVEMRGGGFNLPWGGSKYNGKNWTPGFFSEIFSACLFHLGILSDKNRIKIFYSEIWVEMIFG
jgi:hypothetical protein